MTLSSCLLNYAVLKIATNSAQGCSDSTFVNLTHLIYSNDQGKVISDDLKDANNMIKLIKRNSHLKVGHYVCNLNSLYRKLRLLDWPSWCEIIKMKSTASG